MIKIKGFLYSAWKQANHAFRVKILRTLEIELRLRNCQQNNLLTTAFFLQN